MMGVKGVFLFGISLYLLAGCGGSHTPIPVMPPVTPRAFIVEFRGPPVDEQEVTTLLEGRIGAFAASHGGLDTNSLRRWKFILYNDVKFLCNCMTGDFEFVRETHGYTDFNNRTISLAIGNEIPDDPLRLPALEWELTNFFGLSHS